MPGGEEGTSLSMDVSHPPNSSRAGLKPAALEQVNQLQRTMMLRSVSLSGRQSWRNRCGARGKIIKYQMLFCFLHAKLFNRCWYSVNRPVKKREPGFSCLNVRALREMTLSWLCSLKGSLQVTLTAQLPNTGSLCRALETACQTYNEGKNVSTAFCRITWKGSWNTGKDESETVVLITGTCSCAHK